MNQLFGTTDSLSRFCVGSKTIEQGEWIHDTDYYRAPVEATDIFVIGVYNTASGENVQFTVVRTGSNNVEIRSIDNDPATVIYIYRSADNTTDDDIFNPQTKASVVLFDDGQSLQSKLINNVLYKNSHQDEEANWRKIISITPTKFTEDNGNDLFVIPEGIHGYGRDVTVTDIVKAESAVYMTDYKSRCTVKYKVNGDILIYADDPFTGSVILERKDWVTE